MGHSTAPCRPSIRCAERDRAECVVGSQAKTLLLLATAAFLTFSTCSLLPGEGCRTVLHHPHHSIQRNKLVVCPQPDHTAAHLLLLLGPPTTQQRVLQREGRPRTPAALRLFRIHRRPRRRFRLLHLERYRRSSRPACRRRRSARSAVAGERRQPYGWARSHTTLEAGTIRLEPFARRESCSANWLREKKGGYKCSYTASEASDLGTAVASKNHGAQR